MIPQRIAAMQSESYIYLFTTPKRNLSERVRRALVENADVTADFSLAKLDQTLKAMRLEVEDSMNREIAGIRQDVESALRLKDEGSNRIDREKCALDQMLLNCRETTNELDEIIEIL